MSDDMKIGLMFFGLLAFIVLCTTVHNVIELIYNCGA